MAKKIIIFLSLMIFTITGSWAQVSPKRGISYGYHSINDINTMKQGISWWYNWSDQPDAAIASFYQSTGVEFVPMVWGGTFNTATVIANIRPDAKYLLAFNEPNFNVESNLTPAQAVALWPQIEAIATAKNLQIVSGSAAYCGGAVCVAGYTDPTVWHNEFFALCPTCRVDYIAFHVYEPTVGGTVGLTNVMKQFGRPIWVTEFAWWDPAVSGATKVPFLQQVVNSYENDPDVYRYSWFIGRSGSNSTINILGADGILTTLGSAYINATYPVITVPAKVEAESNYRRRGTGTQATTDIGGGLNVGWTDAGTWNEYLVNVTTAGSYTFNFRIASGVATGVFNILIDDVVVKTNVTVPNTGGWQTWIDLPVSGITLTAGQHLIKLQYTGTGANINYFNVVYNSSLPVEFTTFTTSLNNNHSLLTWTTARELHNDYFIIERSLDGSTFTPIGKVNGNGNSDVAVTYTFEDNTAVTAITYYRLKQVDLNGAYLYSSIISISPGVSEEGNSFEIYPNPSDGTDFIIERKENNEAVLEIRNILGEVLYTKTLTSLDVKINSSELSVSLSKGIYLVTIKDANSLKSGKLIIN